MLYWGIFTAGYILGVVFTLYIFLKKEPVSSGLKVEKHLNLGTKTDLSPDKIFDQLTQINTFSYKNTNKRATLVERMQLLLSRLKTAIS